MNTSHFPGHDPVEFTNPFAESLARQSARSRKRSANRGRTLDTFEAMEARRAGRIIVDDIDDYPNDEDEIE